MSPEQLAILRTVYEALTFEWRRIMTRHDCPAGWLVELHARLSGPEFMGSGEDLVEVWRIGLLIEVEDRIESLIPGWLAGVTPERYRDG